MDKEYLNKVVDQIVSETKIDLDEKKIYTYFFPPFSFSHLLPSLSSFSFTKHCESVYGLNDDEIDYVWDGYKRIILDKLKMGYKFLHRVIDQLVYETEIDYEKKKIISSFFLSSTAPPIYPKHLNMFVPLFYKHCSDVYGLNKSEADYVWDEYKRIINNKTTIIGY